MPRQRKPIIKYNPFIPLLGLVQWGDLGNITIYRAKNGRPVFFPKTFPDKPPSQLQLIHRNRMKQAAKDWHNLTESQKKAYHAAARRLSLAIPPFGLYFTLNLPQNAQLKTTISNQSGVELT
jgi:hypothetical protein